ncbi:MAG: Sec-independent protein translocase subunit TatA/TatB [bacterium]|jgi:sec-independent protein translocase protein TatA|uniref:Sec-independent protein translocase protein TatA n=1 Tax=SAR324 cluster bacterium TaxID=2024889 RepID=A0A2D6YML8_9DELT|nr:twin-arginine translocase TatA/TatE family subunit [SAR324 cluster bacterium]MDA0854769.1 twin-arginine translocase TatA/TatE family subunit [Pseudomonadota bacterium]MEC7165871.1 twin-arginine translocase TatA/TatE family subunit [SAR324 cluster bacterium]MEC7217426.1 twin-arginine translocase TatA/TatE family subunit [SAR324 cluster bacterium]MEC7221985.1 twin-arginine translocase TatA/TatE family subunit [SAR324 cluster bacterium]|tara:strand:- start:1693 stop:1902 length:210 start_codon:yes stop_codon:yes gene_type:complete
MFGLGIWELIIILSIVVMLFGAKRLPMIGEGLGSMITNFKKATKTNELEEKKEESVLVEGSSKEKEGVS